MKKWNSEEHSPWTTKYPGRIIEINPAANEINGAVAIPGSKSLTNRALLLSALSTGSSTLTGILKSDDSYWCLNTLRQLGADITVQGDSAIVRGTGGKWKSAELYIGSAGTVARFLPGILAASEKGEWEIEASRQMSRRPVKPLIEGLQAIGARIRYTKASGYYPLLIKGGGLHGGNVSLSGQVSSQFISGLLLASPYAKKTRNDRVRRADCPARLCSSYFEANGTIRGKSRVRSSLDNDSY